MTDAAQRITDYLSRPGYAPTRAKTLAKRLGFSKKERADFEEALDELRASGRVVESEGGRLSLPGGPGVFAGILKRTSRGSAFVRPHEPVPGVPPEEDVYVTERDAGDAHTGDEVLVRLLKRRAAAGKRCGRVEQILERATTTFVGTYHEDRGLGFVRIDGGKFTEPVYVGDPGAKGARPDDKVVVEMLRFPDHRRDGEAVLVEVLGPRGTPGVDTLSIVHEFGLPLEFPDAVLTEARERIGEFDEEHFGDRLDLTGETIVTIDPVDARDFDDAISLTREKNGFRRLGVHIADVSHFVLPGTPLDVEARRRGNSVYLPRHVIPMLPEVLSNGVCSLQQGQVRYTKSVFIEFSPEGVPVKTEFANSAIKVTRRFAYEEVMPILEEPERFKSRVAAKVRKLLAEMHELAMLLRKRRFAAGALEMSIPEVKLDFDDDGHVTGAHEAEHDESHEIVEEFMLAANCAVARELNDRGIRFLRRVHGDPDEVKLKAFAEFVEALGYKLERPQSRLDLQRLIRETRGKPTERAVNFGLLRSMKRAEYRGIELGHFALAVDDYCHFTSPIRRYPDLEVHRLLDAIFRRGRKVTGPSELDVEKTGRHCSTTERRAEAAERELVKVKLLTHMEGRVGEVFDAVVTGVESFGLFCLGVDLPFEGLAHVASLSDTDYFDHDRTLHTLVGRQSGEAYRLGDRVKVRVVHVDVDRRLIDLRVVQHTPSTGPKASEKPRKRRKKKDAAKAKGGKAKARRKRK